MKIFYCKRCIAKNKDRLLDAKSYTSSLLYEPNVSYKNIDDYKGLTFKGKSLTAECPICKTEMLDSNMNDLKEFDRIADFGNYSADFLLAMIELKKNDIIKYTNQMNIINGKAEEESQKRHEEYLAQMRAEEEVKNTVRCPKCGSTQITTGQRGYSLITGFLGSNKTVNRCAKCGYKWEPKR